MKSLIASVILVVLTVMGVQAQNYMTKTGHVRLFSTTTMEDIEAHNRQVNAAVNPSTGDIVFKILLKSFQFEKALMQEHFNENYVESDKFPNSTFKGKVTNMSDINLNKNGSYPAIVEGDLTIKDVTKKVKAEGTFVVNGSSVNAKSTFNILLADYNIKVPNAVANNIGKSIQIDVDVALEKAVK